MRRGQNPKLAPEEEEALLVSLRKGREMVARAKLQSEAQAVARKLGDIEVAKVADEAVALAAKDKKNFGQEQQSAVAAITLNAVFLKASAPKDAEEAGGGKGGKGKGGAAKAKAKAGGGKKAANPKIGAKIEVLPPPTCDAARAALSEHKATLAKVSKFAGGQAALLRAFEAWLMIEHNEALLVDVPLMFEVLRDEGLVDPDVFKEYWSTTLSTYEQEGGELRSAQALSEEAGKDHAEALKQLNAAEKEMAEVLQRVKWADTEVRNARCGNQPTEPEMVREKASIAENNRCLALKLQQTKVVEMCHKREVTALNAKVASERDMAERTNQIRPVEMIQLHARSFFEPKDAAAAVPDSDASKAAAAAAPADVAG